MQVEKFLRKTIKRVIAEHGINSTTRKGNKELEILVKQVAKQRFSDLEEAKEVGEKIGVRIVEIFRQKGKENLDRGSIRQLNLTNKASLTTLSPLPETQTISRPVHEPDLPENSLSTNVLDFEDQSPMIPLPIGAIPLLEESASIEVLKLSQQTHQ
jgi:hypothetical protein